MAGSTVTPALGAPRGSVALASAAAAAALVADLELVRAQSVAMTLTAPTMAISAGGSALAKNSTVFYYTAPPSATTTGQTVWGTVAVNTNTAAFSGTVTNAKYNVFVHSVADDGTGVQTLRTRMGTEGATRAAVVFPAVPTGEVIYGVTEIHPTGTGNFVGGTTALDDATVVPNAVFLGVAGAGLGLRSAGLATTLTGTSINNPYTNAAIAYTS